MPTAPTTDQIRHHCITLTTTRLQALAMAANGLTSAQIARRLGTTPVAVDLRIADCCRILGTRSRTHAVAIALVTGLIDPAKVTVTEQAFNETLKRATAGGES